MPVVRRRPVRSCPSTYRQKQQFVCDSSSEDETGMATKDPIIAIPMETEHNRFVMTPARISCTPAPLSNNAVQPMDWDLSILEQPHFACDICRENFPDVITKNQHLRLCKRKKNQRLSHHNTTFETMVQSLPVASQSGQVHSDYTQCGKETNHGVFPPTTQQQLTDDPVQFPTEATLSPATPLSVECETPAPTPEDQRVSLEGRSEYTPCGKEPNQQAVPRTSHQDLTDDPPQPPRIEEACPPAAPPSENFETLVPSPTPEIEQNDERFSLEVRSEYTSHGKEPNHQTVPRTSHHELTDDPPQLPPSEALSPVATPPSAEAPEQPLPEPPSLVTMETTPQTAKSPEATTPASIAEAQKPVNNISLLSVQDQQMVATEMVESVTLTATSLPAAETSSQSTTSSEEGTNLMHECASNLLVHPCNSRCTVPSLQHDQTTTPSINTLNDINNINNELHKCPWCPRSFTSRVGLGIHKRVHRGMHEGIDTHTNISVRAPVVPIQPSTNVVHASSTSNVEASTPSVNADAAGSAGFMWDGKPGHLFLKELDHAYEKIVLYKQNIFKLPSGAAGKDFIRETTRLLRSWTSKSGLKDVSWKCIMVMPALLLQKPSKQSKSKDHVAALKRRLACWKKGDIEELLKECNTIQSRIKISAPQKTTEATSKRFAALMKQGKINAAVKLLTSSMEGGILNLDTETMTLLQSKHPEPTPCTEEAIYDQQAPDVHPVVYENINADSVRKAALNTHGGAGPSGVDADGWRHMLVSRNFGLASEELRAELAHAIRLLCIEKVDHVTMDNYTSSNIESFLACRLIPLDKCPGLRPIGVGEVLRRIAGKVVMGVVKDDIQASAGSIQVCAGQAGGCEAAIHGMRTVFEDEETDAILLIDAANAFNSINREAMLKNISRICPIAFVYAYNCYSVHARLFVLGGTELKSKEGTTQGDPTSMALYALGSLPLIWFLAEHEKDVNQVAYADDLSGGGKVTKLRKWFDGIVDKGPLFGYHAEPTKSWLIVKESKLDEAQAAFEGTGVNITIHGKKHLGAVIGNPDYKSDFVSKLVEKWVLQIETLSDIAKFEPHAAYTAFTSCIRHRYTFYLRTIPDIAELLQPLEDAISHRLIPSLTEGRHVTSDERTLLSLPPRLGGMGIIAPTQVCQQEFLFSKIATEKLTSAICEQQRDLPLNFTEESKSSRSKIRSNRRNQQSEILEELRSRMSPEERRTNDINQETGASIWLSTLPIEQKGFFLTKREFWDSIHLRYGWPLPRLPSKCACGEPFNVSHALSCKKGGFVAQRHNELRDMTADLLSEVCRDVCVEPTLNQLTGETLSGRSANTSPEARLDVSARGVWVRNQRAFFDIRVFYPNARRFQGQSLKQTYISNEKEKKRAYNERVLEVEGGTFTPLVFSVFGGMGEECKLFFKRLSSMLSEKRKEDHATVATWVRRRVCFALLRSALTCLRGTRHRYYKPDVKEVDMEIDLKETNIREE